MINITSDSLLSISFPGVHFEKNLSSLIFILFPIKSIWYSFFFASYVGSDICLVVLCLLSFYVETINYNGRGLLDNRAQTKRLVVTTEHLDLLLTCQLRTCILRQQNRSNLSSCCQLFCFTCVAFNVQPCSNIVPSLVYKLHYHLLDHRLLL
jgi:hypothetical protein